MEKVVISFFNVIWFSLVSQLPNNRLLKY
uniref:Uncharacterized protein n=1 Tax=Rhizophora mucronata TaxID=61149 RepID=A0A2P2Q1D6_RHIMU